MTWEADPFPPAPPLEAGSSSGIPPTSAGPAGESFATPREQHHVRIVDLPVGGGLAPLWEQHPLCVQTGQSGSTPGGPGRPVSGTPKSCFPSTSKLQQQKRQGLPDHPILPKPTTLRQTSAAPRLSAGRRRLLHPPPPVPPPLPSGASHQASANTGAAAGPQPIIFASHDSSGGPGSAPAPRVKVKPYHTANRQLYNLSLLRTSTQEWERDK